MKVAVCILALLATVRASPIESEINYSHIKPIEILHVDVIAQAPVLPGSRIIGGTEVQPNSIPYQASLIINNIGLCGGSLISRDFVLTAAHCVDFPSTLGAHNILTTEATQQVFVTSNIIIHPGWIRLLLQNDIAVIKINAVDYNDAIQPIGLAPANAPNYAGSSANLTGWGRTSDSSNAISAELRFINLPIITNVVCQNSFGSVVQATHICTSGAGNRGACNGDSGGPLVVNGVQVGVVSVGSTLCATGNPTAYTRVSSFRAWINQESGV